MNFKGMFKDIGSDLVVGGTIAATPFGISKLPFMNDKPVLKNVLVYGALKMVQAKAKKGVAGDVVQLNKMLGIKGFTKSYIGAPDEFIKIEIPSRSASSTGSESALNTNNYVTGQESFSNRFN